MEPDKERKPRSYGGIVMKIEGNTVECEIHVGTSVLGIPFARDRFYKDPMQYDWFYWHPTEDGSYSPQNFEVFERGDEPLMTKKEIEKLPEKLGRFRKWAKER